MLLAVPCLLTCARLQAQKGSLFPGAEPLDTCGVELPLTYAAKDAERIAQAARFLEDVELVYLTFDRKASAATYRRVYVLVEGSKDGAPIVYLESADDHLKMGGKRTAEFPKYNARTQRFYEADRFDARMEAHPELMEVVREE